MAGLVDVYRGKFPDAISALEQAVAAQSADVAMPWRLPARVLLAKAYAALGRPEEPERVRCIPRGPSPVDGLLSA